MKTFIGGIGCFWDETKYEGIEGVISTECGYCGGDEPNVTYKAVCGGDTGHIEVVKVCLLYTSPSPRDATLSRMPSSA